MKSYVVQSSYTANTNRGLGGERTYVEAKVVEAESVGDAVDNVVQHSSVGAIKAGLTLTVKEFSWDDASVYHVTYDGDPIADGHGGLGAHHVITEL